MIIVVIACSCTLQKQIGCFNYRVVTLVANKLKKHWLGYLLLLARQPLRNYLKTMILYRNHDLVSTTMILQFVTTRKLGKGSHICLYQRAHSNNYDLADIVTTGHL